MVRDPKSVTFCEGCNLPCPSPCKEVLHAIGQVTSQSVQVMDITKLSGTGHIKSVSSHSVNRQSRTCGKE
jgi:hypothetical protein